MDESKEYNGKQYKPPRAHPWRNAPKAEVARWAKDKSDQTKPNNFKIGQLNKKR